MENKDRIRVFRRNNDSISIAFGAHHYINITKENEKLFCEIGCTHHGVKFEATEVHSELQYVIDRLRELYPNHITD